MASGKAGSHSMRSRRRAANKVTKPTLPSQAPGSSNDPAAINASKAPAKAHAALGAQADAKARPKLNTAKPRFSTGHACQAESPKAAQRGHAHSKLPRLTIPSPA